MDVYDEDHSEDITIKRGHEIDRVVRSPDYGKFDDKSKAEQYVKDVLEKDRSFDEKYVTADNIREIGFTGGADNYLERFVLDKPFAEPEDVTLVTYLAKKDLKIASGKKVVEALINELGSKRVSEIVENAKRPESPYSNASEFLPSQDPSYVREELINEYKRNGSPFDGDPNSVFNKVNKKFKDAGYDGIEDITDIDSDLPVLLFESTKSITNPVNIQRGREALRSRGWHY